MSNLPRGLRSRSLLKYDGSLFACLACFAVNCTIRDETCAGERAKGEVARLSLPPGRKLFQEITESVRREIGVPKDALEDLGMQDLASVKGNGYPLPRLIPENSMASA